MKSASEFVKDVFAAMEENGGECMVIIDSGEIRILPMNCEPKMIAVYSSKNVSYRDLQEWILDDAASLGLKN